MEKDIIEYIKKEFNEEDFEIIVSRLKDLDLSAWKQDINRIYRCILYLSKGNLDKIDIYIKKAQKDFRDIIVEAEYDSHYNQLRNFNNPF